MRARLLAISDRHTLPRGDVVAWAARLAAAGIDGLQLREKDLCDGPLLRLARAVRAALPAAGGMCLLVNGRADVALAAGAHGVHLPSAGLPVGPLRHRFGPGLLLGRSTHRLEEVEEAAAAGADYVTFGPVYATPSKARYGPPPGLDALRRACSVGLPVYALGGVTLERLAAVAAAGAAGAAGIRIFQRIEDLPALVRQARRCFPLQSHD